MITYEADDKKVSSEAKLNRFIESLQKNDWEVRIQGTVIMLTRRTGEAIHLSRILNGVFWRATIKTRTTCEVYGLLTPQEAEILAQRQINVLDQERVHDRSRRTKE